MKQSGSATLLNPKTVLYTYFSDNKAAGGAAVPQDGRGPEASGPVQVHHADRPQRRELGLHGGQHGVFHEKAQKT